MGRRKYTFQINYKSGISMRVAADDVELEWRTDGSGLIKIALVNPHEVVHPNYLGIDSIESVWRVA